MLRAKILLLGQRLIERGAWYFAPISLLYALAVHIRNKLYDWKIFSTERAGCVVVSVGNVVAGGSGKTPFVHMLAKRFAHRRVAILSRGYGEVPDEAMLLAKWLPNVSVLVGKDRAKLARNVDADLIILDDGFQHRRLHRDFDIVLGERMGRYLPWGFLRDNPKRKADVYFALGNELALKVKAVLDKEGRATDIAGWEVVLFCGIAKPERFKKTVESLGAKVVAQKIFADHEMADLRKLPKAKALICTEKDFIKLPPTELPIYYLQMEMEVVNGIDLWEMVVEKIDQKIDNRPRL